MGEREGRAVVRESERESEGESGRKLRMRGCSRDNAAAVERMERRGGEWKKWQDGRGVSGKG